MSINREGILFENFIGGINEALAENLIGINECSKAQNMNISDGNLSTANLSSQYADNVGVNMGSIITYYKNNVGKLLVGANGTIKLCNGIGSGYTNILTGQNSNFYDGVNFNVNDNDVVIMGNGTNTPIIYDGNIARKLKNRRKAYNEDGTLKGYYDANETFHENENTITTYAPNCRYIELHYERIWMCGDSNNPSKVYFSTADVRGFDPEDFTAPTNEEEVNQHGGEIDLYTNDGGKIIGLKVIYDDVVIFKDKNIFKIFGNNPNNYTKIQIFSSNGAIADKSIVNTHAGAFFINTDGIYIYDGTNVRPISQKINKTFANLNQVNLNNAVATFFKGKYILAVPEGSSTTNNLVIEYDINNKSFMFKRGMNILSFAEFNNNLLYSSTDGYIYKYNEGPVGQAYYETGTYDFGYINSRKDVERFYFIGSGNGNIKIMCITDKKTTEKIITLSDKATFYRVKLKNKGRTVKYRIENINNSTFNIKSVKAIVEIDVD